MFVDRLLDTILRPFREISRIFSSVNSTKAGIQMDAQRIKQAPQQVRSEMNMAVQPLVQTGRDAAAWRGQAGQQAQVPQNAMVVAPQPEKKKMSWWPWSKKTCIRCSQKLQKDWDQCPYCGQNQNAPVGGAPGAAPGMPGQAPGCSGAIGIP